MTGLTEVEKEEGEAAKKALAEEAGERPEDAEGSDDENYKKNNQFGEHMKRKNEAVRTLQPTMRAFRTLLPASVLLQHYICEKACEHDLSCA